MLTRFTCHVSAIGEVVVTHIQRGQRPIILWIAVNNSSSASGQMGIKMAPKRPQLHIY
jgi:hypothetical protein